MIRLTMDSSLILLKHLRKDGDRRNGQRLDGERSSLRHRWRTDDGSLMRKIDEPRDRIRVACVPHHFLLARGR